MLLLYLRPTPHASIIRLAPVAGCQADRGESMHDPSMHACMHACMHGRDMAAMCALNGRKIAILRIYCHIYIYIYNISQYIIYIYNYLECIKACGWAASSPWARDDSRLNGLRRQLVAILHARPPARLLDRIKWGGPYMAA